MTDQERDAVLIEMARKVDFIASKQGFYTPLTPVTSLGQNYASLPAKTPADMNFSIGLPAKAKKAKSEG